MKRTVRPLRALFPLIGRKAMNTLTAPERKGAEGVLAARVRHLDRLKDRGWPGDALVVKRARGHVSYLRRYLRRGAAL